MIRIVSAILFLVSVLPSQVNLIVDQSGGAGSQFTTLPAAVSAAQPDDVILVRAGNYKGFNTQKPLVILFEANALITREYDNDSMLRIANLPAGKRFVLRDLRVVRAYAKADVRIEGCSGVVLLERARLTTGYQCIVVRNSAWVGMTDCTVIGGPAVTLTDSRLTYSGGILRGRNATYQHAFVYGHHAVDATRSIVELARCDVRGGSGMFFLNTLLPGNPAVVLRGGSLRLRGDAMTKVYAGNDSFNPIPAVAGTSGAVIYDPRIDLQSNLAAPLIATTLASLAVKLPALATHGAAIGGLVEASLTGSPGDSYALFVGEPAVPFNLPSVGEIYFRLAGILVLVDTGVLNATGAHTVNVTVPRHPSMIGRVFGWQALTMGPTGGILASNPGLYAHGL